LSSLHRRPPTSPLFPSRRSSDLPTTIAMFQDAVLDPAKRAHYRLAWLSTVDHKRIAVLYMLTALVFFVIAGVEALFMRLQLAIRSEEHTSELQSRGHLVCRLLLE